MTLSATHGVVFDMGDILYDATGWRRWLTSHLVEHGIDIDYDRLVAGWEDALVPVYTGKQPYWEAFAGFVGGLGVPTQEVVPLQRVAQERGRELSATHRLFDGVAEGLARMKQSGLRLAILSDNEAPAARIRTKLQRFDVDHLFDEVLSSLDIGVTKPHQQAFEKAIAALGVTLETTAFVAHDMDELQGSTGLGMYTVAYNYTAGVPADVYAETFADVADALIEWGTNGV